MVRSAGGGPAQLRVSPRWTAVPPAAAPAARQPRARRRCVRDPRARRAAVRLLALARRLLPCRRRERTPRAPPALAAPRAELLDPGRRRGRDNGGDPQRGGHARARPRELLARAVPVRRRRADHLGGRRGDRRPSRERCLPIPSSTWRRGDLALTTTAFAAAGRSGPAARARYRVENAGRATTRVRLFVALRPFQVTPPWQAFQGLGGTSPIRELAWRDGAVVVNGSRRVVPLRPAERVRRRGVRAGRRAAPPRARRGAAAHAGRRQLRPCLGRAGLGLRARPRRARTRSRWPYRSSSAARRRGGPQLAPARRSSSVTRFWEQKLGRVRIRLPATARGLRRRAAHGDRARPGVPRRPGAPARAAALHALVDPRRRHHGRGPAADGLRARGARLPALVRAAPGAPTATCRAPSTATGPDWLPEHDSHGQLAFTVAEYFRFTGDRDLARELWPAVRARDRLPGGAARAALHARVPHAGEARLLRDPAGVGQPRGLPRPPRARLLGRLLGAARHRRRAPRWRDALGDDAQAARLAALRDALHERLYASIEATIADAQARLRARARSSGPTSTRRRPPRRSPPPTPRSACRLARSAWTFDEYLRGFRRRRSGEIDWNNYTAYEIRILGALVRLGRRDDAHELLEFFLADRRPRAWNQWPEISWRDPRSPGHLGDVPHAWIGAEYVLALLEHARARAPGGLGARARRRRFRRLARTRRRSPSSTCRPGGGRCATRCAAPGPPSCASTWPASRLPPGGIVARPPLPRPLMSVEIDGAPVRDFARDAVTLRSCPASVVMRF